MAGITLQDKSIYEIFNNMDYGPVSDSTALAEGWLKDRSFGPFIDGEWKDTTQQVAGSGSEIFDPCTRKPLATVFSSTNEDVSRGISSSNAAFKKWSTLPGFERSKYLYSIARHLQKNISLLVQVESLNRGVQSTDPREFDVPVAVRQFYYYAGWTHILQDELDDWEPLGTVLCVTSSCCPLAAISWMVAPAIAAGNTVILRPSSHAPLSAMLFADICKQAGLPPGVLNILPGGNQVGEELVFHSDLKKITFCGRTAVGRQILQQCAHLPYKKFNFLLSGRTPMIVFETADIDSAVDKVVSAAWFNQGQVAWAVSTLLVQESVFEEFIRKLKEKLNDVKVGTAFDKMADVGIPLNKTIVTKVNEVVSEARKKLLEVYQAKLPSNISTADFFQPTLIINGTVESNKTVSDDDLVPVVTVRSFRTAKEAITLANNSRYGVAASLWTENASLALEVANQLQVSTVWINSHGVFDASVPFGGWKQSGLGCFGGKRGLLENLKPKGVIHPVESKIDFSKFGTSSDPQTALFPTKSSAAEKQDQRIDCTFKLYYGGGFKRPDSNTSRTVYKLTSGKEVFTLVPDGSRKDVRNAVEAAVKAQPGWWKVGAHLRSQILYNMAEKFQAQKDSFVRHLHSFSDCSLEIAEAEVNQTLDVLFYWAGCCDKQSLTSSQTALSSSFSVATTYEPVGVIGVVLCRRTGLGLLSFIELVAPAICYGNAVIIVPNEETPTPALEFCQILSGCDLPGGVVNILTGDMKVLVNTLAQHQDVRGLWTTGDGEIASYVMWASSQNMKRTWVDNRQNVNRSCWKEMFEYHSTQNKTVWFTSGEIFSN